MAELPKDEPLAARLFSFERGEEMKKRILSRHSLSLVLSLTLTGLLPIISSCSGGGGGGTPVPPPAPTGVFSLAGDGLIALGWNASAGATSYNLYMASSPGVTRSNYSSLPNGMKHAGVNSPFTLTGLANGTNYYFVVTAVNAAGESGESSESSGMPAAGPGDPLNYFPMTKGSTWTYSGIDSITGQTPVAYTDISTITGTKTINGAQAIVWSESNQWNAGKPEDDYYVKDSNGLIYLGSNEMSIMVRQLIPYWEVKFPLTAGSGYVLWNKTGMDFGEDADLDGINETFDVYATITVLSSSETVTVPAGTFTNCVKIEAYEYITVTLSKTKTTVPFTGIVDLWTAPGVGIVKKGEVITGGGNNETKAEELTSYAIQ
jgi:hypothetical protein